MTPLRNALAINALEDELEEAVAFARAEGLGLEVTAFAYPAGLEEELAERIERHRAAVEGVTPLSCHGPFLDLYVTSPEPGVVELCPSSGTRRTGTTSWSAAPRSGAPSPTGPPSGA